MAEDECRKGPWTNEEDILLIQHVNLHGEGRWNSVSSLTGLKRNGKSCRLRWVNYLRPDLKKGQITPYKEKVIVDLHARWGNRWSTIARSLPGRTDNEIKNYWRTNFKKRDGNPYSENSGKAKARLLRKQQFQQQLLQMQQNAQMSDMKRSATISLLDENDMKQNEANPIDYANSAVSVPDDLGFFYSMFNSYTTIPEDTNEDTMWDGLWNLDDVNGSINYSFATNAAMPLHTSRTQ